MEKVETKGLGKKVVENLGDGIRVEVYDKYAFLVQSVRFGNIATSASPATPLENANFLYLTMKPFEEVREVFDNLS